MACDVCEVEVGLGSVPAYVSGEGSTRFCVLTSPIGQVVTAASWQQGCCEAVPKFNSNVGGVVSNWSWGDALFRMI